MSFQPADNLKNRTFIGLIIAQFLAGFNDQAIHAASMFYAIHRGLLTEPQAISLMPILFYAPWALFVTASAYLADRYSKTSSIVFWKFSEIVISIIVTIGFWLGTEYNMNIGVWLVLSAVFLMGTHAAFFSPAKYGAMPEVLQAHVLSKGNGVLESTTFLANILGTVSGGLLSFLLHDREYAIGLILLALSIIGALASLMMVKLPASDPKKRFNLITPLTNGLRTVFHSRPLALAVMGIAFFVFMVSYMRSTMYMHGQTRVPPWDDFHTSLVVAAVALGVGLGSPLAGWLSGGKIELGLVPVGCLGMMAACGFAAFLLNHEYALVAALIGIGFFSGFYMVPLYSLLQHRAPKISKGEIVAVSNFFNVTGAMSASLLFFLLVLAGRATNLTPVVEQKDRVRVGEVIDVEKDEFQHVDSITIEQSENRIDKNFQPISTLKAERTISLLTLPASGLKIGDPVVVSEYAIRDAKHYVVRHAGTKLEPVTWRGKVVEQKDDVYKGKVAEIKRDVGRIDSITLTQDDGEPAVIKADSRTFLLKLPGEGVTKRVIVKNAKGEDVVRKGDDVVVSSYRIHDVIYYVVRPALDKNGQPTKMKLAYDNEELPQYLFLGAGGMTLGILILLSLKLPDFFVRTAFWWKSLGKRQLKAIGMDNLPTGGPVILATNCTRLESSLQVVAATDRHLVMILAEADDRTVAPLLRRLSRRADCLVEVPPGGDWSAALPRARAALKARDLVGFTADGEASDASADAFLSALTSESRVPILPVWCGSIDDGKLRVVFGEPLPSTTKIAELRASIQKLKVWIEANDGSAAAGH